MTTTPLPLGELDETARFVLNASGFLGHEDPEPPGKSPGRTSNGDGTLPPGAHRIKNEEPGGDEAPRRQRDPYRASPLVFEPIVAVLAQVDNAPPPTFLARPVWPSDAYGIIGATMKAGKTWLVSDLMVATASGGAWLGHFAIESQGPVLAFFGEGGRRKMARRLRAIAAHYGVNLSDLPIRTCFRVPHLTDVEHLQMVRTEIASNRPELVVIDPLYLAARGAQGSQLYEMGAALEGIQVLCQDVGAALVVVHHFNRSEGRGMGRLSGAGPAEWGRVLVTAEVKATRTDPATKETAVTLELDFVGDEIPEITILIRRKVSALDPDDLASPLVYSIEVLPDGATADATPGALAPSRQRVLAVLQAAPDDEWLGAQVIGDRLAVDSSGMAPLKRRTIQDATKELVDAELVESRGSLGSSGFQWRVLRIRTGIEAENGL